MSKDLKDKFQEIADGVQARLCGFDKNAKLYEEVQDQGERIQRLTGEVKYWKEKFDRMWQAWHNLAKETKGAEEAAKMAAELKAGR